jgi:predicted methyltransferase
VLAGEHRSAENRGRDEYRHPLDTLLFFGIKPDMTVVEVWPGARGWYAFVVSWGDMPAVGSSSNNNSGSLARAMPSSSCF